MKQLLPVIIVIIFTLQVFSQRNPQITAEELKADVYLLASDSLRGRKPGTPGADLAAHYIRDQFMESGLRLMGDDGFQWFDIVTSIDTGTMNRFEFQDYHGIPGKDFIPLVFSANARGMGTVVFAGYGFDIDLDSLKWNDYKDVDVKGKWVMLFRGDPEYEKQESRFIPFSETRGKILVAKDHGALGVLVVTPPGVEKEDKLLGLFSENNDVNSGIPVINLKRSVADKLVSAAGFKTDSLEKILIRNMKPLTFEIKVNVSAVTDLVVKKAKTANVIAMVEGNDPVLKNEFIVIGGHYDHLGYGGHGSGSRMPDTVAVHYGADDNASGTAMVIELAGRFGKSKPSLKRSLLFVCFSAEEMGLLGSKYFVEHPPVDIGKIKAMINFDMVGRFDTSKNYISVSGTGTSQEGDSILNGLEKDLPFKVIHVPDGYGPSDHAAFYAANIPVFYFSTGAHIDYHTPFDQASRLDYDKEKLIGDFASGLIQSVAGADHSLSFKEAGRKESSGRGGRRLKVTLGIMPDFAGTEKKGLRVDGVTKDGPAYKGGLLKGDIIISINGLPVANVYDYMTRLGKLKSGQTISVEVIRGEKHEVLIIQL